MDLPVWSDRFKVPRVIYHLMDWVPGFGIPLAPLCAGVVVMFSQWRLVGLFDLHNPLPPPYNLAAALALPAMAWYLAGKPAVEGRPLPHWLLSQARYLLEPRVWVSTERIHEPRRVRVDLRVHSPGSARP